MVDINHLLRPAHLAQGQHDRTRLEGGGQELGLGGSRRATENGANEAFFVRPCGRDELSFEIRFEHGGVHIAPLADRRCVAEVLRDKLHGFRNVFLRIACAAAVRQ